MSSIHALYRLGSTKMDMICCSVARHDYYLPVSIHYVNLQEQVCSYDNLLCVIQS